MTAAMGGCSGGKDGTDTGLTGETGTTNETGTMTMAGGFQVDGTAVDIATQVPAAEGLCVDLIDPSPALTGGAPVTLLSTVVGANGAFSFTDVVTDSVLGLLMSVKDCDAAGTVFTSATGIPVADYADLADGAVIDATAYSISTAFLAGLQGSATAAGYAGDLATEGLMFGFVFDASGAPVAGATVSCADCGPTFYIDGDAADGAFTTAGAPNTATDPASNAAYVIPAAPIGNYTADDGGAHDFGTGQLNGSTPGSAVITAFYGI